MNKKFVGAILKVGLLFLALLSLVWPAIQNGFPLLYSDSGTYMAAGHINQVPVDRPIMYPLFVRHTSMSFSLWLVLLVQSGLVFFSIYKFAELFILKKRFVFTTVIAISLSFLSGLSNYTSQIMPDIYTGILILAYAVLVLKKQWKGSDYLLAFLAVFSGMVHFSNLILIAGLMLVIVVLWLLKRVEFSSMIRMIALSTLPFLLTLIINHSYDGRYELSKGGNVFRIGRMAELGLLKPYLREFDQEKKYALTQRIDEIPEVAFRFVWETNSPLYDSLCLANSWTSCWTEKNNEYGEIVSNLLQVKKFRSKYIATCWKDFLLQSKTFTIGGLDKMGKGSIIEPWIDAEYQADVHCYKTSHQYQKTLVFNGLSQFQNYLVGFSALLLVLSIVFFKPARLSKNQFTVTILLIVGILGNALTVVLFSGVVDRYQGRVIWILPMVVFLVLFQFFTSFEKTLGYDKN